MSLLLPILCYYWIEFYVVMYDLKRCLVVDQNCIFHSMKNYIFLQDFISMSVAGRDGTRKTQPRLGTWMG